MRPATPRSLLRGRALQKGFNAVLKSRWIQGAGIALAIIAIPAEAVTLYRTVQETLINENKIREGTAKADNAEAVAKISLNKLDQSISETAKMKADADSAESLALINRNKVGQSESETTKMKADADRAQSLALVNRNKIPKSNSELIVAQESLKLAQDIERRERRR
jgi:hypothetical protein